MADDNKQKFQDIENSDALMRTEISEDKFNDPAFIFDWVKLIWQEWADFELTITSPNFEEISPPAIVKPALLPDGQGYEFVYDIHDHGYRLVAAKTAELFADGRSMCKLFYTIEKMIAMLVERLESAGIDRNDEVQVAFDGYISARRKAFESIINLPNNVVVVNFEPEEWGERYLDAVKRFADKYGFFPSESPRDIYKKLSPSSNTPGKRS